MGAGVTSNKSRDEDRGYISGHQQSTKQQTLASALASLNRDREGLRLDRQRDRQRQRLDRQRETEKDTD